MTYADVRSIYIDQLAPLYDKAEAAELASLAIEHVCEKTRSFVMLHKSEMLSLRHETEVVRILDELRLGQPLQYVLGTADFYGLKFKVNRAVLIPRAETEELVNWILTDLKDKATAWRILDMGTGSGCIPVVIKKNLPGANVEGMDISEAALSVAEVNSKLNGVEVKFWRSDILEMQERDVTYDIIVSNPPYIRDVEKKEMRANVLHFEPHGALFVPDGDPLIFYRHVGLFARKHLSESGRLFFEINEHLGAETTALLREQGFEVELRLDMQGKHRMIKAWLRL